MRRSTAEEVFDLRATQLLAEVCDCMEVVKEVHLALQGYLEKISEPSHKTLVEVFHSRSYRGWLVAGSQEPQHQFDACGDGYCPFHEPSLHSMRNYPMSIVGKLTLRHCPHGEAHPDPDSVAFLRTVNPRMDHGLHKCACKCCEFPSYGKPPSK